MALHLLGDCLVGKARSFHGERYDYARNGSEAKTPVEDKKQHDNRGGRCEGGSHIG